MSAGGQRPGGRGVERRQAKEVRRTPPVRCWEQQRLGDRVGFGGRSASRMSEEQLRDLDYRELRVVGEMRRVLRAMGVAGSPSREPVACQVKCRPWTVGPLLPELPHRPDAPLGPPGRTAPRLGGISVSGLLPRLASGSRPC